MAINPQKLLPQSNSSIVKVTNTFSSSESPTDKKNKKSNFSPLLRELLIIKNKTTNIEKILKNNLNLQKANDKILRKNIENTRFSKKEKKLEEKEDTKSKTESKNILPQFSIFDRINRFITFTFLGWLTNKFFKYLPQILDFVKKIEPVVNFFETLSVKIFDGFVSFIDAGYSAYDKVREFSKTIGGEGFQKTFDDFSSNLNKFVNLAIIAGIAASGGTDFGLGNKGAKLGQGGRPRVTTSGGGAAGRPDLRNPLRQRPTVTGSGGGAAGRPDLRNPLRQRPGVTTSGGKIAQRAAFRSLKPLMGRIPIIGGLIEFGLSWALGDPIGKAAFRGIGALLVGAVGTAIGGPLGAVVGSWAGGEIGAKLYEAIFEGRKNQSGAKVPSVKAKAKGGQVTTRGGKKVGGAVRRTLRRRISAPKTQPLKPGEAVGGKEKYQSMFPEPKGDKIGKSMNPYGFLTDTANEFSKINIVGALSSVFMKPLLGELPTKQDYRNFGLAINAWINNAILKGTLKGNLVKGFAEGGIIDNDMTRDISGWAEKSLEQMIKDKVTKAINDLRKNLGLEPLSGTKEGDVAEELGEGLGVDVSSDSPEFWLLATAAMFENSNPQGAADVAQVIYNRVALPGDPWNVDNSISKAILNPGQFQPVRQYGGTGAWSRIKTKDDAIRFARTHGKTQEQLETVAAALLDKEKQRSARDFVGPRDSFRAEAYEKEVNHLANETEKTRHGHTFGFEPRGATIASFKAGRLSAAMPTDQIQGDVTNIGSGTGGEYGRSARGTKLSGDLGKYIYQTLNSPRDFSQVSEHPNFGGSFRRSYRSWHNVDRAIDIGGYWPKDQTKILAKIQEFNRKNNIKPVELLYGKPGTPEWETHKDHVHVAYKGGGVVGSDKTPRNTKPLEYDPDYSQNYVIMIQPIIQKEKVMIPVPIPSGGQSSTIFSGDLNNMSSSMFVS